jgi:hypothetical protein
MLGHGLRLRLGKEAKGGDHLVGVVIGIAGESVGVDFGDVCVSVTVPVQCLDRRC